jgi:hypothetical protein
MVEDLRDKLREAFGVRKDVNEPLAEIFGDAYLDFVNEGLDDVPDDLKELADSERGQIVNVSGLLDRSFEIAQEIVCPENQELVHGFIQDYIHGSSTIEHSMVWTVFKHMETCHDSACRELSNIMKQDKYMTPERMGEVYEEYLDKAGDVDGVE